MSVSRSSSVVREARPLDRFYDPIHVQGSSGQQRHTHPHPHPPSTHRPSPHQPQPHSLQPFLSSYSAPTETAVDGSGGLFCAPPPPPAQQPPLAPQLRALVTGPARLAFFRKPSRAHHLLPSTQPSGGLLSLTAAQPQPLSLAAQPTVQPFPHPSASASTSSSLLFPVSGLPSLSSLSSPPPPPASQPRSSAHSVGVQSEYREGWSQTLPYSPDVLVDPSPSASVRELLSLQSTLSYLQGSLPASSVGVELIEAAREKAEWEAALPPLTSAASYAERQRRVEEREWKEWAVKEERHRREDERRMQRLIHAMNERQAQHARATQQLKEERGRAADEAAGRAEERRVEEKRRAIRLLGKQRLREERREAFLTGGLLEVAAPAGRSVDDGSSNPLLFYPRRGAQLGGGEAGRGRASSASAGGASVAGADAVFAAVDFGSAVYAPLARSGSVRAARGGRQAVVDFDIPALRDFDQLTALAGGAAADAVQLSSSRAPLLPALPQPGRAELQRRRHLQRVDSALTEQKEQLTLHSHRRPSALHATAAPSAASASAPPSSSAAVNVYKAFCPVVRAPTPSIPATAASDAAVAVAALTLQRLMRGRAAQSRILRGVQRHEGLLLELSQSAHHHQHHQRTGFDAPSHDEADEHSEQLQPPLPDAMGELVGDRGVAAAVDDAAAVDGAAALVDCLLGVLWSDAVLGVQRGVEQEAQLQSLSSLRLTFDFVRRVRESEEGGRRQAQEERRRAREAHAQQLSARLQRTVAAPLVHSILHTAKLRSVAQTLQRRAEDEAAEVKEVRRSDEVESGDASLVIGSLLDDALFPCVVQQAEASRTALRQRRFLVAAHRAVQDAIHTTKEREGSGQERPRHAADQQQQQLEAETVS